MRSGYEGLTTTLLAERAEVAIGSVYQFFPDKRAIVQALAMRNMDAYLQSLSARFANETFAHWWDGVDAAIDVYIHMHRSVAGFRTLHFGDVVDVHLLDVERDNNAVIADRLAELLVEQFQLMDRARLRFALQISVEAADALIKLAFRRDTTGDEAVLTEAKALIREYLHRHVDGLTRPSTQEGMAFSAVRRGRRRCLAVDQLQLVDVLAQLAGLGVPEPDPVARAQRRRRPRRAAASAPRRRPRRA